MKHIGSFHIRDVNRVDIGKNLVVFIGKAQAPERNNTLHITNAYVYIFTLNARRIHFFPLEIEAFADGFNGTILLAHVQFHAICNLVAGLMVIVTVIFFFPRYRSNRTRRAFRRNTGVEETQLVIRCQITRTWLDFALKYRALSCL